MQNNVYLSIFEKILENLRTTQYMCMSLFFVFLLENSL